MKEALFVKYDQNKNFSLISAPKPIKYFPEGTNVLYSLIAPSITEGNCSDAWKFVARHFTNRSSHIKGIGFYQSYIPVARYDSFIINIAIAAMHKITDRILYVSN